MIMTDSFNFERQDIIVIVIGGAGYIGAHVCKLIASMAAAGKRGPLTLFGRDYDTPECSCVRDYTHVNDIVRAHGFALQKFFAGLVRVTGLPVPYHDGSRRAGEFGQLYADASWNFHKKVWGL